MAMVLCSDVFIGKEGVLGLIIMGLGVWIWKGIRA